MKLRAKDRPTLLANLRRRQRRLRFRTAQLGVWLALVREKARRVRR